MNKLNLATIVLAAGEGKRMKSNHPKVLHKIAGKPMLLRTVEMLQELGPEQIIVVASPNNISELKKILPKSVKVVLQPEPKGTADAARAGLNVVGDKVDDVAVLYGDDTAFYKAKTVQKVFETHTRLRSDVSFVTLKVNNPHGLGRIVRDSKHISIVEEKDASPAQRKINEVNDGLYIFKKGILNIYLPKLKPSSVTGELYITDLIEIVQAEGKIVKAILLESDQWHGVNTPTELAKANFRHNKSIHVMGIWGAGASAIAGIAKEYGFEVSGCDISSKSAYSNLPGTEVQKNHSSYHINRKVSALIVSPAIEIYNPQNPELLEAKNQSIPVITWQEFQGHILQDNKFVIAIAGGYGKSTTTAMISQVLTDAGLDPTCEIGAKVISWKQNFRVGKSKYYICEADEYNNNYLNYRPDIGVVLNVAWDHPDFFKNEAELLDSYRQFIGNIKEEGTLVIGTDPNLKKLVGELEKGSVPKKVIEIGNFEPFSLSIIGKFRKENANAALTVAKALKIDTFVAKKAIESFQGLGRRLEYKGDVGGVKFYDDYAVQPYTIENTANALYQKYKNKRVLLALEPHTHSRVHKFFDKFVEAIKNTKITRVLITNTFLAREHGETRELSAKLAKSIGSKAKFTGSVSQTAAYLKDNLKSYDVVCTMGAGDVYKIFDLIKNG